jgi:hypothetical protein
VAGIGIGCKIEAEEQAAAISPATELVIKFVEVIWAEDIVTVGDCWP